MASSAALVEEAVRRARYQPEGVRSYRRSALRHAASARRRLQVRPHIYPMIEDRRGVRDIAEIAQ